MRSRGIWANALFAQIIQPFVPFSKLIREMPLKYELIKLKKKKKKNCMELEFMELEFH